MDTSFSPVELIIDKEHHLPRPDPGISVFVQQSDGKILIGGTFTRINGVQRSSIARLNADGSLDEGPTRPYSEANGEVEIILEQPDGKILIGGGFTTFNGEPRNGNARLNADGSLDPNFIPNINGSASPGVLQSDGKILISGSFTEVDGVVRNGIARLHANGSLDPSFDTNINDSASPWGIQPDGKILISGFFTEIDGVARSHIARLNADGSLDASFNADLPTYPNIGAAELQADGKVLLGRETSITRLNADGSLDTGFSVDLDEIGEITRMGIGDITVQPDGKILVGLTADDPPPISVGHVFRLNADGALDTSFNIYVCAGGTGGNDTCNADVNTLALQPDGKVLFGGHFDTPINVDFGGNNSGIARLNADGTQDTSFDPGDGVRNSVSTIALLSDGKMFIGGSFYSVDNEPHNNFAKLNANGSIDTSFNYPTGSDDWIQSIAVQSDNKLLIGGFFTAIDGIPRNRIARLNIDRSVDLSFDPGTGTNDWISSIVAQSDGKVLIGGNFTEFDGVIRNYIARLNPDGSLDTGFDAGAGTGNNVRSIALQSDGKVLVGGWFGIARLFPDGSLDGSFSPNLNDTVYAIAQQGDGKILIAGKFTEVNGESYNRTVRLNPDGSIDSSFNPGTGANGAVYAMALQPDGKVVIGGDFHLVNGMDRTYIARLNEDGSVDAGFDFDTGVNALVLTLALQADDKILLGGFFSLIDGVSRSRIARLNPDGSLDTDFDPGTGANGSVETMALQGDGSVVIGGHFTEVDGIEQNYISRLSQSEAALQQLSAAVDGESLTWLRDGVGPVLERVTFEVSDSLYGSWTMLGNGQRIAGGWSLDGLNLPVGQNIYIRARGYYGTNASSMTESILQFYLEKPSIKVSNTATPSVLKEPGGTVTFNVAINNTSATNTVTIDTLTDTIYGNLNGEGNCSVPRTIAAGGRYNCAFDADITGSAGISETDKVTASGADEYGNPVSDSDSATVNIIKDGNCVYYTPKNKSPMMICW